MQSETRTVSDKSHSVEFIKRIERDIAAGRKISEQRAMAFHAYKSRLKRNSFYNFCKEVTGFDFPWFQKVIIEEAQKIHDNMSGRMMVQVIQQHGKSYLLGTLYSAYILGLNTEWKVLYLTYSDTRAKEVSANLLEILTSSKYQELFPDFKLKDELSEEVRAAKKRRNKLTISNFTNANSVRGEFKACGIEGSYNGYDANFIVLDDYFAGQHEAISDVINETRWLCWTRNILTRQQKDNIIIIIGTQWRKDDIIGRMSDYIKEVPEGALPWTHLVFNAMKDDRNYDYDHREIGEYLWPERKLNFYLEYKALDPIGWAVTGMNQPEILDSKLFDINSFRIYDEAPDYRSMLIVISCDPNYSKTAKKGDKSAVVVLGLQNGRVYLLDFWGQARVSHSETMHQIDHYKTKYPNYMSVLVEDKAGGEAIAQLFEEKGEVKLERFINNEGKKIRAQFMIPYTKGGLFYVPSEKLHNGVDMYLRQFYKFTGLEGGEDDFVDATTQFFVHYSDLLAPPIVKCPTYAIKNKYFIESKNPFLKGRVYAG